MHWWGVGVRLVSMWRRTFSIGRMDTPGSARLVLHACQMGADAVKAKEWTAEELEEKRQLSKELNLRQHLSPGYNRGPLWSPEEPALLGAMPDDDVAERIGRTVGGGSPYEHEVGYRQCKGRATEESLNRKGSRLVGPRVVVASNREPFRKHWCRMEMACQISSNGEPFYSRPPATSGVVGCDDPCNEWLCRRVCSAMM
jgi:hypothetical protein